MREQQRESGLARNITSDLQQQTERKLQRREAAAIQPDVSQRYVAMMSEEEEEPGSGRNPGWINITRHFQPAGGEQQHHQMQQTTHTHTDTQTSEVNTLNRWKNVEYIIIILCFTRGIYVSVCKMHVLTSVYCVLVVL